MFNRKYRTSELIGPADARASKGKGGDPGTPFGMSENVFGIWHVLLFVLLALTTGYTIANYYNDDETAVAEPVVSIQHPEDRFFEQVRNTGCFEYGNGTSCVHAAKQLAKVYKIKVGGIDETILSCGYRFWGGDGKLNSNVVLDAAVRAIGQQEKILEPFVHALRGGNYYCVWGSPQDNSTIFEIFNFSKYM